MREGHRRDPAVIRVAALAALLALAGCGAAVLPVITGIAGAGAVIFRLDTTVLDFAENLEGRTAVPKAAPNSGAASIAAPASTAP
jgi:hypothetical protein